VPLLLRCAAATARANERCASLELQKKIVTIIFDANANNLMQKSLSLLYGTSVA